MTGTIYNRERTSEPAFRSFIRLARTKPGFLPPWWDDARTEECIRFSRGSHDFSLEHAVEKHDVQEQWRDDRMPMKLRMLGEKVYGTAPGGAEGASMLGMMMAMEGGSTGGMLNSILDINNLNG